MKEHEKLRNETAPNCKRKIFPESTANTKRLIKQTQISTPGANKPKAELVDHFLYDLVWAKLENKPWWPAQICPEPVLGNFKKIKIVRASESDRLDQTPHYYVKTFDLPFESCWVSANCLKTFRGRISQTLLSRPSLNSWGSGKENLRKRWERAVNHVESLLINRNMARFKMKGISDQRELMPKQVLKADNEKMNHSKPVVNDKSIDVDFQNTHNDEKHKRTVKPTYKQRFLDESAKQMTKSPREKKRMQTKTSTLKFVTTNYSKEKNLDHKEIMGNIESVTLSSTSCVPDSEMSAHLSKAGIRDKRINEVFQEADDQKTDPEKNEIRKTTPTVNQTLVNNLSKQSTKMSLQKTEIIHITDDFEENPKDSLLSSTSHTLETDKLSESQVIIMCEIKNGTIVIKGPQQAEFHSLLSFTQLNPDIVMQATLTIKK